MVFILKLILLCITPSLCVHHWDLSIDTGVSRGVSGPRIHSLPLVWYLTTRGTCLNNVCSILIDVSSLA